MEENQEQKQVKQDIAKARQSYKKMLEIDNPLKDIAPVDIDIVPLGVAMMIDNDDDDKKNRQE